MNPRLLLCAVFVGTAFLLLHGRLLAATDSGASPTPVTVKSDPAEARAPVDAQGATSSTDVTGTKLTTAVGDLILVKAEIVAADPQGRQARAGFQILHVTFKSANGSEIDGMKFYDASQAVHVKGDDGSKTDSHMGGLVDGELIVGFTPPVSARGFTLFWPGNEPVRLTLAGKTPPPK